MDIEKIKEMPEFKAYMEAVGDLLQRIQKGEEKPTCLLNPDDFLTATAMADDGQPSTPTVAPPPDDSLPPIPIVPETSPNAAGVRADGGGTPESPQKVPSEAETAADSPVAPPSPTDIPRRETETHDATPSSPGVSP